MSISYIKSTSLNKMGFTDASVYSYIHTHIICYLMKDFLSYQSFIPSISKISEDRSKGSLSIFRALLVLNCGS